MLAKPHHIIAIGASAGGMEEINSFFDHTPLDGVSYVVIQHLSANYKSQMVQLLAKHSKLVVLQAEDGMAVQGNQVYLIPNDKFMTISNGKLYLSNKKNIKGPHLTINVFFNTLAKDYGKKAIAVVLSGLGSDGTEGIENINKAGGMVIARNPETTEFGSMPSHAIATGLVDFVLEPESMPEVIEDYVKYGAEQVVKHADDSKSIKAIVELIKEKSALDFTDYKLPTILRRTKRRAAQSKHLSLTDYLEFLKSSPKEVDALAKEFLISVTSFFRDPEAFDFIEKNILSAILEKVVPGEELKIWVAGCATGEEAYSLAILVAEQLADKHKNTVVKIFATDVDIAALNYAGKGIYPNSIEKNVSAERLEKFFIKEGDHYRVKPEIRSMLIFAQHDLIKNTPYCNMHFISCRNLLIYLTPVLQKKVFSMMLFGLKLEGFLFLGSSENPFSIIENLKVVNKKWKLYQNLTVKREVSFDAFSLPELSDIKRTPKQVKEGFTDNIGNSVSEAIQNLLANQQGYLAICIDENNRVVKSYGDTKYLLQGHFNLNLPELLPKPLAVSFNTLVKEVNKTKKPASLSGIKIKQDGSVIKLNLAVSPLALSKTAQSLLMVTFSEDKLTASSQAQDLVYDEKIYHDQYTANLEEELKELKINLNSAYERLDASNENMQSFNEELISANEEMQSTNEEMQSVNEELHTINADYQLKYKELLEINDDLNNYFRSNINGQLFINNDLILMKFSPGTVKQINLLETDIGRPLSNISTNIKFETIIDDIKQVLAEGIIVTKEVETNNGKWYQIMTMPYVQQADNKRNGAIITFNDITALKNAQLEVDKKNRSLVQINSDLDNFVHVASHDLLAPLANIETSISVMNLIKVTDPVLLKFITIINKSIEKFRMLIKDISVVAKIEGDALAMEMVDIEEVISNIKWGLESKISQSRAVIVHNLEVKQIFFSKKNFRSILHNLVSNAIKFSNGVSPVVHIHSATFGNDTMLSVQDNGRGIAKNELSLIFELHGRLHKEVEGQGVGLYLVKKMIDAAGGEVTVESEPNAGSKFTIYFKPQVSKD